MTVIYNTDAAVQSKQDDAIAALNSILTELTNKSTALNQATANAFLSRIATAVETLETEDNSVITLLNSILTALANIATAAKQDIGNTSLASIDTKTSAQSTAAKQDIGNASLASIDSKMGSTVGTLSTVAQATTSSVALAANANRRGMYLYNDSGQKCYIAFAATASSTAFTLLLAANAGYESPQAAVYRGVISVVFAGAGGGALRVTELT